MLTSSPASMVVDSSQVLSTVASPPAATASSPEATFAWLSNVCVTSPSAQMFWLTDWSTMVSRSSTHWKWVVTCLISFTTWESWCSGTPAADVHRHLHRHLHDVRAFDDDRRDGRDVRRVDVLESAGGERLLRVVLELLRGVRVSEQAEDELDQGVCDCREREAHARLLFHRGPSTVRAGSCDRVGVYPARGGVRVGGYPWGGPIMRWPSSRRRRHRRSRRRRG